MERDFTETVDTVQEGVTIVSKMDGRFCAATGKVTLGGRRGTKSKAGFHGMDGRNNVAHRSTVIIVDPYILS